MSVEPGRLDGLPQEIVFEAGFARHDRPQCLGDGVASQRMAAHAHHVLGRPALRAGRREAEFERQPLRLALDQVDIGIDAIDEGYADRPRVRRVA